MGVSLKINSRHYTVDFYQVTGLDLDVCSKVTGDMLFNVSAVDFKMRTYKDNKRIVTPTVYSRKYRKNKLRKNAATERSVDQDQFMLPELTKILKVIGNVELAEAFFAQIENETYRNIMKKEFKT